MSTSENGPFILRFSKSMIRPNPRSGRGGKPRTAEGAAPNPYQIADKIEKGFAYYRSFEYNSGLPVFSMMELKAGSLSKSLRYHFFKTTGTEPVGSISSEKIIFSHNSSGDVAKFAGVMRYSRNKAFRASCTHLESVDCITPADKKNLSDMSVFDSNRAFLHTFCKEDELDRLIHFLKYQLNVSEAEPVCIGGACFIRISGPDLSRHADRLFTHSLIRSAGTEQAIVLHEQYIRHEDLPMDCIITRKYGAGYPAAAVVDSGLSENSYLKEWEIATESFLDDKNKNPRHGTFVCGRLLTNGDKFGGITYLNVEIIPGSEGITIERFHSHMKEVLEKYHTLIKVYNISLGTDNEVSGAFSLPAHTLDKLQKDYDVLFVISAGNADVNSGIRSRITSPAESVHAITVGSVSHAETNIQKKLAPSLFTRHGPGSSFFIKPDVSSFGGAHEERFGRLSPVGVFSIGSRNELAEDCGTSHAAPVVASLAARLYYRYSHVYKSPFMAKAMIIHYTFLNNEKREPDIFTGYGVAPENLTDEGHATYLHEGEAEPGKIVELPEIPVPPDMFESGKASGEIVMTLVYKTETNISYPHYYCMYNLEASLGYYKDGTWKALLTSGNIVNYAGTPEANKKDFMERFRWQPTKVMSTVIKNKFIPENLSLRIIPSKRDFYKQYEGINYYIVISFIHRGKNLYQCLKKLYTEYNGLIEPASDMWKTCG